MQLRSDLENLLAVIYMQCIYKADTQKSVVYSRATFLLSSGLMLLLLFGWQHMAF